MNIQQYKKICSACDRILHSAGNNDEIVSFPILHVIREHPEYLKQYNFIFPQALNIKSKSFRFLKKLNIIFNAFFDSRIHDIPDSFEVNSKKMIIVSHIHNENQCNNFNDASFGLFHNDLLEFSDIKPIILLINHTNISSKKLARNFKNNQIDRIVMPKSSGIFNELKCLFRIICSVNRFSRSLTNLSPIESSLIEMIVKPSQLAQSMSILRIGFFVERLVNEYSPKYIITTYEGFASERIIFSSARNANQKILCFGFQHSVINKYQHSLARSINKKYNPDHIFCCGDITKDMLKNRDTLNGIETSVLGSPNGQPVLFSQVLDDNKSLTFLFLPEGIQSEYQILFKFILDCAKTFPSYSFVWRSHPSLDLECLDLFENITLPSNIIISKNTFEDDLKRSTYAIYRGTTAIIRAVKANVIPIYLKMKGEIGIDILHELDVNRVSSPFELKSLLSDSKKIMNSENNLKFCNNYFRPLDHKSFIRVISRYDAQ